MTNITTLIQTAERMIRDNTTSIGAICAEWNRINFEAHTGLSFSTPTRRSKLIERLEAAIIELNSRDSRMDWDGKDNREFSGNSIAAAHDEAFKMDRERTEKQLWALANNLTLINDTRVTTHNDLCDLVKAPQHLYAGEELDLTVCFNRKSFERLQQQLNDFINKETPRYFKTNTLYKVSTSGFVERWSITRGWLDCTFSIIDLINFGGKEITEAEFNATISSDRATISAKGDLWYVMVDGKHLYEFDNEYDAVEYAQRVNTK